MAIYKWRDDSTPVTTWGIYRNQTLGLISIGSGTSWVTMADKNLGATTVRNSWDTASESNCGKFYQWGNNYGFPYTWTITMDTTQIDVTNYWPNNYYSSSTFIKTNPWYLADNFNLWGWLTDTDESTQGPCDTGFHIPGWSEIWDLRTYILQFWLTRAQLFEYLKWSYWWKRSQYSWNITGTVSTFWSATLTSTMNGKAQTVAPDYLINSTWTYTNDVSDWCSIRPFANTPVQPDTSWTVLYQAS